MQTRYGNFLFRSVVVITDKTIAGWLVLISTFLTRASCPSVCQNLHLLYYCAGRQQRCAWLYLWWLKYNKLITSTCIIHKQLTLCRWLLRPSEGVDLTKWRIINCMIISWTEPSWIGPHFTSCSSIVFANFAMYHICPFMLCRSMWI